MSDGIVGKCDFYHTLNYLSVIRDLSFNLTPGNSSNRQRLLYDFNILARLLETFVSFINAHFFKALSPTDPMIRRAPKME